jgi:hypothetical protein
LRRPPASRRVRWIRSISARDQTTRGGAASAETPGWPGLADSQRVAAWRKIARTIHALVPVLGAIPPPATTATPRARARASSFDGLAQRQQPSRPRSAAPRRRPASLAGRLREAGADRREPSRRSRLARPASLRPPVVGRPFLALSGFGPSGGAPWRHPRESIWQLISGTRWRTGATSYLPVVRTECTTIQSRPAAKHAWRRARRPHRRGASWRPRVRSGA